MFPFFQVLLITVHTFIIAVHFKFNRMLIIFHPLSVLLWTLIVLNSMRLTLTNKSLAWKERIYTPKKHDRLSIFPNRFEPLVRLMP